MQMIDPSAFQIKSAIVELETGSTFSALELQQQVTARRLEYQSAGVLKGQRVILVARPRADFFIALFALQQLGAFPFIIDAFQTTSEHQALAASISPHWIVDSSLHRQLAGARPPLPTDTAMVLFTSGTSALPKAVIHRYENLLARLSSARQAIPIGSRQKALCTLPLHFGHGLIGVALQTIQDGTTLVLAPKLDLQQASRVGEWIDQHEVDFVSGTPASWSLIARFSPPPKRSTLQRVQLASAHATKKLFSEIAQWAGAPVFYCYGLTETASWVSDAPVTLGADEFPVGNGELWSTRFRTDSDGQIYVATKSLFAGYWGEWLPQAAQSEWYSTGDLGYLRSDGQLVLTGRLKRQINRGGLKVSPEEVELAILETGLVKEVVVLEAPRRGDSEVGSVAAVIVVEAKADRAVLIQNLEKHLREVLSAAKIPSNWRFEDRIPRRSNGKPDLTEIGLMFSR
ncbi:MAG: acyl--CoA ligase [Deltaproteobacteria bacterium]|jgi:acyl-CoA synthetase (AMP-forming)/AMP-acid ligase II|nr:acyl--CoA ligase [Deltaproteobacteria bacterium]